jgi:histidyl-tRNA synthetase
MWYNIKTISNFHSSGTKFNRFESRSSAKGRFRDFFNVMQMWWDSILWQEVELVQLYDTVLLRFLEGVTIKINNRKILSELLRSLAHLIN